MSLGRILWMWAWRLAIALVILWQIRRFQGTNTMIVFVLMIPVIGVLLAKPILESVSSWFKWARKQPYEKWQGNYYEYANVHIRVFDHDDELWFCDVDIFKVLELPVDTANVRTRLFSASEHRHFAEHKLSAFSEAGVQHMLTKSQHRESRAMLLWIEREVLKPHRRKIELRDHPYEAGEDGAKPLDIIAVEHISETDRERRHQKQ
jgi:hypothetical protein